MRDVVLALTDFILANRYFNVSGLGRDRLREYRRWKYGVAPVGNAVWVQHTVEYPPPAGVMGSVLANSSMSWNQSTDSNPRRALPHEG